VAVEEACIAATGCWSLRPKLRKPTASSAEPQHVWPVNSIILPAILSKTLRTAVFLEELLHSCLVFG